MRIGNHNIDNPDDWRWELTAVTQRLLGDTIALGDSDWQVITGLGGWTRAHVASHLAHQAETLAQMADQITRNHEPITWRDIQSDADLNAGARRSAVGLQEALDQSSATLMNAFTKMDDQAWATTIRTSQGALPASVLVLDRLNEVTLHHIDLRLDFDFADVGPTLTRTLLQWNLFRAAPRFSQVELTIVTDEAYSATVGQGEAVTVRGNQTNLLGWLTGRKSSSSVLGADELDLAGPV
ncbi:MAG: maleylpyruvate isomerase family mycothiol-dependent enzyme [Propionibacteriaceae bacterium]|nr:maleylpyruvate isomerase family mycothiol-dependent enzyme [Propionibacteriaceae bacterium]